MLSRQFIVSLWSPARKGLTSWLLSVVFIVFYYFPMCYSGSGAELDCIVSWSSSPQHANFGLCPQKLEKMSIPFMLNFEFASVGQQIKNTVSRYSSNQSPYTILQPMYGNALLEFLSKTLAQISLWIHVYKCTIIEPVHEISNNVVSATSKASDQPAHTRSLIRAFASRLSILKLLSYWQNTIWSF